MKLITIFLLLITMSGAFAKNKNLLFLTKDTHLVFFKDIKNGCKSEALKTKNNCIFIEMNEGNPRLQIRKLKSVMKKNRIDGIALAVIKSDFTSLELKRVLRNKKIPLVTLDADFNKKDLAKNEIKRSSYIGTNNYDLGKTMAQTLLKEHKADSHICIISGHSYSDNLNQRIKGFKDVISEKTKNLKYLKRCPLYSLEKPGAALSQTVHIIKDSISINQNIIIAMMGGWAQDNRGKYISELSKFRKYFDTNKVKIISIDTTPNQLKLLNMGLGHLNVGQSPKEIGRTAFKTLLKLINGEKVEEYIYTPIRVCLPGKC